MADPIYANILGIDDKPPILDTTQVWRYWSMGDIFLGLEGDKKYVPKVRDYVIDLDTQTTYEVESIDSSTYVPSFKKVLNKISTDETTEQEGLFFGGIHPSTPCARQIFYDDSTSKPTLCIPAQLHIQGTMHHHAICFKGSVAGQSGIPISIRYDASFNPISHSIPLEPIARDQQTGLVTQWAIPSFYCSERLVPGELVLIIIYDDRGGVTGRANFIVEPSALLRDVGDADKFVAAISLESYYIDSSDDSNLLIPEGILKNSLNLMGKVWYTDGSSISYPINGDKFELLYLDRANESIPSTKGKLVLKYILSQGEKCVDAQHVQDEYFYTRTYNYTIIEKDGSYSVKLYPVPVWVNETTGYTLNWYMFNLDRNAWYDVSNQVYIAANSPTKKFNGTLYGPNQQMNVAINLGTINSTFQDYVHPQQVDVRLMRPAGDTIGDRWYLSFDANQAEAYGNGLKAVATLNGVNNTTINISNGFTTKDNWLKGIYEKTYPLYRITKEPNPPKPNMFAILNQNNTRFDFPISMWNSELPVDYNVKVTDTIKVLFYKETNDNELYLSMAPLSVLMS